MISNEDQDLADLRQSQLKEDMAETINFCIEHLDRARDEALKGIIAVESLPHPSRSEAEGDAKWRAIEAFNAVFVRVYRCAQALEHAKINI